MSRPVVPPLRLARPDAPTPPAKRGALSIAVSVALHALALAAVLVVPPLSEDQLPEVVSGVRAFFATPLELAPPPPPPPPPPAPTAVRAVPRPPRESTSAAFVAPVEVPTEIVAENLLDLGIEGGGPGGVEGGVPGGVVGAVVGGLPEAPPPPRLAPRRAGSEVREPRRLKSVTPVYPQLAILGRVQGEVVLECTIDVRGRVAEAKVLGGNPLLDEAALEAVRQWVYTPTLVNGVPVPVLMTVTVTFRLTEAR